MLSRLIIPLVFGLAGTAILIGLGVWQLQRLDWKQAILTEIDGRISAAPVAVPAEPSEETDKYLPVSVTGQIAEGEVHVLVSKKRVGAGYRIIAPFVLDDGRRILLDRGFTKTSNKAVERTRGGTEVIGNLHWPDEISSSTPEPDLKANIWFARDVAALADHLNSEPVLIVARSVSPDDKDLTPMPVDTSGIPNDHWHYAITWFSLAVVWIVMTGFFILRGRPARKDETT